MKFTKIPADAFKKVQLNCGMIVKSFTPGTATAGDQIGITSGGINFKATPSYKDFGDDIDNCPKNTMQLKKLESWEATMSGTFASLDSATVKSLIGAAGIDSSDATHVVPRNEILSTDFSDIWWVGDYSDYNGATNGGFCAIHLMNALSTDGFQVQSSDKEKGKFAFTYTAHYDMTDAETVPFEIYIKAGTAES